MKDVILNVLQEGLKYDDLRVEGSDAKYEVKIISDEFKGKTIIQRKNNLCIIRYLYKDR